MQQNPLDKRFPLGAQKFTQDSTPASASEKAERIGAYPTGQAEKLLAKPIPIPRNPWALIIRIVGLMLLADVCAIVGILLISLLAGQAAEVALLAGALLLLIKTIVLIGIIVRAAMDWVTDSYEITERQLIKKKGTVTKEDDVYELVNTRQVSVRQSWLGRQLEYGNIELLIATAGLNETITLYDIRDPHHFEDVFREYLS